MSSIVDLKKDISDFATLLNARPEHVDLKESLSNSLCARIGKLSNLCASDAIELTEHIQANTCAISTAVQGAVDARMAACATAAPSGSGAKPAAADEQSIRHVYNYFTEKDYATLDDFRASRQKKIDVIVFRLHRLGVVHPGHDSCLKWCVTVLLHCEFEHRKVWPDYASVYSIFRDLVDYEKSTRASFPFSGIVAYPEKAEQLPNHLYKSAYDAGDPPVERYIARYIEISKHVPLRSNSSLLAKERAGGSYSAGKSALQASDLMSQIAGQLVGANLFGNAGGSQQQHVSPSLFMPQGKSGPVHPAPSAKDNKCSEPAATDLGDDEPAPSAKGPEPSLPIMAPADDERVRQEAYEEAALKALKAGKAKAGKPPNKKPAGACSVLKRPAAAPCTNATMKRPASAASLSSFKVEFDKKVDSATYRNQFCSKWYGRAKNFAKLHGLPEPEAKAFMKAKFAEAGALWDKHCK